MNPLVLTRIDTTNLTYFLLDTRYVDHINYGPVFDMSRFDQYMGRDDGWHRMVQEDLDFSPTGWFLS